ncbi:hypothetical protein ACFY05_32350 [Microtetraspora fusca]|uniref:Uncharacterized protein n=1 Tax=Microtetraspora fusca TaxID=1997 RepID=A0ABW6VDY7_MICFU
MTGVPMSERRRKLAELVEDPPVAWSAVCDALRDIYSGTELTDSNLLNLWRPIWRALMGQEKLALAGGSATRMGLYDDDGPVDDEAYEEQVEQDLQDALDTLDTAAAAAPATPALVEAA